MEKETPVKEMTNNDRIREVLRYLKDPDYKQVNNDAVHSLSGRYLYSPLDETNKYLRRLLKEGQINPNAKLLDAGSGDGRVVFIASANGLVAYGAENEPLLYGISTANLEHLTSIGVLDQTRARIIGGDFLSDRTYQRAGVRFEDFGTVFSHSLCDIPSGLVRKVLDESKKDVKLIHLAVMPPTRRIEGLKIESTKKISQKVVLLYASLYSRE